MQKRPCSLRRASSLPDFIAFKSVALIKNPALGEGLPDRGFFSAKGKTLNNQQSLGMFAILDFYNQTLSGVICGQ